MVALHGRRLRETRQPCYQAFLQAGAPKPAPFPRGHVTVPLPAGIRDMFRQLGPVLTAAVTFSAADISGKVALMSGADVLSLLSFRSAIGVGLVFV
jgi:hypothetical protein